MSHLTLKLGHTHAAVSLCRYFSNSFATQYISCSANCHIQFHIYESSISVCILFVNVSTCRSSPSLSVEMTAYGRKRVSIYVQV